MKAKTAIIGIPPQAGQSAGPGGLGIPAVLAAIATNLRFSRSRQPGTLLRMLSLIAITAALRSRGVGLAPDRRQAVIDAMELGALLNDRFDGDPHDPKELRARMNAFAQSMHREVIRSYSSQLRRLERSRPDPAVHPGAAVREYRENVNRLSLAMLWALGSGGTLKVAELEIEREPDLRLLFQIVMLAQVIDDALDARQDRRQGLPTFATSGGPLRESIAPYAEAGPIRFDRNFCLHVAHRVTLATARLVALTAC